MAYKITDICICCGACISECPNGAIREGETTCYINPDRCTECVGAHEHPMCDTACAVGAPALDPEHKESREQLLEKWKKLHPGKTPKYV
jgi:ferredoxin